MERVKSLAEDYGFTDPIDCGAVQLHMVQETNLTHNTPHDGTSILAENIFDGTDLPSVTSSTLELSVDTDIHASELLGRIKFAIPSRYVQANIDDATILKDLGRHLQNTAEGFWYEYQLGNSSLRIVTDARNPISVELIIESNNTDAAFEVYTPLSEKMSPSKKYDRIKEAAVLWGQVHDFLATASDLPYNNAHSAIKVIIGKTREARLSNIELAVEARLGKHALDNNCDTPLFSWLEGDIESGTLTTLEELFDVSQRNEAAERLLEYKQGQEGLLGKAIPINQGEIIRAMCQVLSRHPESPDENNHRD